VDTKVHKKPGERREREGLLPNFVRPSEKKKSRMTCCFEKNIYIDTRVRLHAINNARSAYIPN
jgi:hypothetical protein